MEGYKIMRKWSLLAGIALSGCGGGSGGGDATPVIPPAGNAGVNVANGVTGEGDGVTCKSLDCMGADFTRSVVDPQKFVRRCAEGLQMVDDLCAEPRAVVTAESDIEFGNVASPAPLFKASIDGQAKLATYLKRKELPLSGNTLQVEYEYRIEGDEESTGRLNSPGITLTDDRFDETDGELYFGVPGFESNPIAMHASIFGEQISGTKSYSEFRNFCSAVIARFSLMKKGLSMSPSPLPEIYDGREWQNCSVAAYPGTGIERMILYSVCRDADRCLLKSVSVWRATKGI